jgi:hypothetical protein
MKNPIRNAALPLVLACCATLASAQPKPAIVKSIDEAQRTPLAVTLPLREFFNCTTLPAQCQTPVPAGKRFVIESVGADLQISKFGGSSGNLRGGLMLDLPGVRTYFPMLIVTSDTSEDNWAYHTPFRGYVDPGQSVSCSLNGVSVTGTPSFSGHCVLAGYLIDKP